MVAPTGAERSVDVTAYISPPASLVIIAGAGEALLTQGQFALRVFLTFLRQPDYEHWRKTKISTLYCRA